MIHHIVQELDRNKSLFKALLLSMPKEVYLWKPTPDKWCILEVLCHLFDEEQEDFRTRIKCILEDPTAPLPSIDPVRWVDERQYIKQHFEERLQDFLNQRELSVEWLQSLKNPNWNLANVHPEAGTRTAQMFLYNWLAHDYIHIRQINRLKFEYLNAHTKEDLSYAGRW